MQPEENTVFNTFVCIEAGVKEIYVTVFVFRGSVLSIPRVFCNFSEDARTCCVSLICCICEAA